MANNIHTPDKGSNYSIRQAPPADRPTQADDQPWNHSTMEVEPMPQEAPETQTQPEPKGRFNDRIKVSPVDSEGRATKRALKGWPTGLKKA
jgi:hypothetical protein